MTRLHPVRVFIAYHDFDLANAMAELLRAADFNVDVATESVKMPHLDDHPLTIVYVVDLDILPKLDGILYVCNRLRKSQLTGEVIVIVTSGADDDRKAQIMKAGAHFYLPKPVDPAHLLALCEKFRAIDP